MSAAPWIEVHAAAFGYAGRPVLQGVDLEVAPGDFLGILGPNGAGKTTLLRGLLGLLEPLAGRVTRRARRIGYVPQQGRLDHAWPLSAREVVEMGGYGRLRGLRRPSRTDRAAVRAALERVGLADRADAPFAELSGGQRQRVLIARALLAGPEVLVLDEPTSGVDRPNQAETLRILRELSAEETAPGEGRPAILLVAHQLELLAEAVTSALWVADGAVHRLAPGVLSREHLGVLFEEHCVDAAHDHGGARGPSAGNAAGTATEVRRG